MGKGEEDRGGKSVEQGREEAGDGDNYGNDNAKQ